MELSDQSYSNYQEDITAIAENPSTDEEWIALSRTSFQAAEDYQESSLRPQWARGADHFNSQHAAGSRYHSKEYLKRSKLFRPLSRTSERNGSASVAESLFSNSDMTSVVARDQDNEEQVNHAKVQHKLLEYRLEEDVDWYMTAMGAWQDSYVYGPAVSFIHWDFMMDEDGKIVRDKLAIDLIPPENFLFSPAADWRDVIGTSPYLLMIVPMFIVDIEDKMADPVNGWRKYERNELISARDSGLGTSRDSVRRAREGQNREDSEEPASRNADRSYEIVDCILNIVQRKGKDYVYWTAGTQYLLTEPVPIEEVFLHGRRPFVYGQSVIEAHRTSPNSQLELIAPLQETTNEVSNQRVDNVRQVLNKRYFVRRGSQVDLAALARNVPGGSVSMNNPEKDVQVVNTPDITTSSYAETERLNMEADDLSGTFSTSTVGNSRSLNETVGGMAMLSESSNKLQAFDIRTFVTTFIKPTLQLALQVIQEYETDEVVIALCGANAETSKDYEVGVDTLFTVPLTLKVNAGIGATSPSQRINNLVYGLQSVAAVAPAAMARIKDDEIVKEVFAALGYDDGERFITPAEAAEPVEQPPTKEQVDMQKLAMDVEENEKDRQLQRELKLMELAAKENMSVAQMKTQLAVANMGNQTTRDVKAADVVSRNAEMNLRKETGEGI